MIENELADAATELRTLARRRAVDEQWRRMRETDADRDGCWVPLDPVLIALADRCVARGWRQTEEDPQSLLAEARAALAWPPNMIILPTTGRPPGLWWAS